jgi:hypothetical protein
VIGEDNGLELGAEVIRTPVYDETDPNNPILTSYTIDYRWVWGYRSSDYKNSRNETLADYTTDGLSDGTLAYNYETNKIVIKDSGSWREATADEQTDDWMLWKLCRLSYYDGYEDADSLLWNDWIFAVTKTASNGETPPTSITEDVTVRLTVEMSTPATGGGDVEHTFYSGWVSILPDDGLTW